MKQSTLVTKTLKEVPKDETSLNAKLLIRGGFIDKLMAGVFTILPLGLKVLKKIEQIIREEINAIEGQEIFMPALHPIEYYIKTKRDKINVLFYLKSASGKKLVLGQSHEEVIVPLVKKYISSYKDLPIYLYQIQVKFRNELRVKSGILRGREFMMKDLYSFHRDQTDFESYYDQVKESYHKIFKRAGIGNITYLTLASGGTFSKYSHEFQTATSAGEDEIHICQKCKNAINDDIISEQKKTCPECSGKDFQKEKAIEVGNIFPLGTRFSDAFDLKYVDERGKKIPITMGSYGIGLGRLMGSIVEINNDKAGIIWPKEVAPFQVHLLSLSNNKKLDKKAENLYQSLQKLGFEVLYDDRGESSASKLKDADLIGIPIRLIISDRNDPKVEIKLRDQNRSKLMNVSEVKKNIKKIIE